MTPAARLQATIDLLDALLEADAPADQLVASFLRGRRYIGGGDRRAILERTYAILRHRAAIRWWLSRTRMHENGRAMLLAALTLIDRLDESAIGPLFDGGRYSPAPLSPAERTMLAALAGEPIVHADQPGDVRHEIPVWAEAPLRARFGAEFEAELEVLNRQAALDLRTNTLVGSRDAALGQLQIAGIAAEPTPLSPLGIRIADRPNLPTLDCFKRGLVEVQDEGSQLIALLVDARPGMRVVDFCAGAGGKTLALAAAMENRGVLVACDVVKGRVDRAGVRLRRAGVHNVQRKLLEGERDPWVKRHAGRADRVLVDAPCTGSGTWRRNPDQRWRIGPDALESLAREQAAILDSAARLVRPGGRLIYATCSFFHAENEAQIEAFVARTPGFALLPVPEVWAATLPGPCPDSAPMLMLTPARNGTDGFFVAILQREGPTPA
jgi:16S rRNA (cytosine967-C5)-methyltransferase